MPVATSLCIRTHSYSKITCVEEGKDQKFMVMLVYLINMSLSWTIKNGKKYKISVKVEYIALLNRTQQDIHNSFPTHSLTFIDDSPWSSVRLPCTSASYVCPNGCKVYSSYTKWLESNASLIAVLELVCYSVLFLGNKLLSISVTAANIPASFRSLSSCTIDSCFKN